MNIDEESLFSILEALEKDHTLSQRGLAKHTGLNLAKVNFCLKKLFEKGYVKFQKASRSSTKLRYLYIITPKGFQEKAILTYKFIKKTLAQYEEVEEKIWRHLEEMRREGVKKVVIAGDNEIADLLCKVIKRFGKLEVTGIYGGGYKKSSYHNNLEIQSIDELEKCDFDVILIADGKAEISKRYLKKIRWIS